ncbi:sodium-dependent lysophosphatidylcholine symporter 1-B-like isoform X1 [Lineus longissimus]|uniref:sodium-dependent lysophosphatidylcholine symporter 1-B-like isoform X1 n=2 Tax=Lineus longissimus TaxID=88925 RepID=UPI00315D7C37
MSKEETTPIMGEKEEEAQQESGPTLPVWRRVCFALGGLPYQTTGNVIGFFIPVFLLEVANLNPFYVSVIVLTGKAWDAITDPIVGYLVSRTNTRFGKMRPWLMIAPPFTCVTYFFLWYVPDISDSGKLGYYFIIYCGFMTFESCVHVPYTSLTMYISDKQVDRDSCTAYRMIAEVTGLLFGVAVQGVMVNPYRVLSKPAYTPITDEDYQLEKTSYLLASAVIVGLYVICIYITFFGTKERKGVIDDIPEPFFQSLKMVFSFGPYVKLTMAFLFISLATQIVQGNLALYITHSLKLGSQFSYGIFALVAVAILVMPLWQLLSIKIGKKISFAIAAILYVPVLYIQLFLPPKNMIGLYGCLVLAGAVVSASFLLPWSMLPDVLDDFMLKKGHRKDAVFYSFYVFFNKLSVGVSLGISQLALGFNGYDSKRQVQPDSVAITLRMLIAPVPIVCCLISLIFIYLYPIDEKRRQEIRQSMEQKGKEKEALRHSQILQDTGVTIRSGSAHANPSFADDDLNIRL